MPNIPIGLLVAQAAAQARALDSIQAQVGPMSSQPEVATRNLLTSDVCGKRISHLTPEFGAGAPGGNLWAAKDPTVRVATRSEKQPFLMAFACALWSLFPGVF
jgi:hypothetical protein